MASKNARRRFDDPVIRTVVLDQRVRQGSKRHHVVEQHYREREIQRAFDSLDGPA